RGVEGERVTRDAVVEEVGRGRRETVVDLVLGRGRDVQGPDSDVRRGVRRCVPRVVAGVVAGDRDRGDVDRLGVSDLLVREVGRGVEGERVTRDAVVEEVG